MKIFSCTKITEMKNLENVSANQNTSGKTQVEKTVQGLDEAGGGSTMNRKTFCVE
jgi:hypothetical protein